MARTLAFVLVGLALAGCLGDITGDEPEEPGDAAGTLAAQVPCNGSFALCDRRLSDVVFPGTHNSFATSASFTVGFRNQNRDIRRQLDDGIRAFMLDTYWHKPFFGAARAALCHKFCTAGGYVDLVPELRKLRDFLAAHPGEVVLLLIEPHSLTPAQFHTAMQSASLATQTYVHPSPSTPWPTLGALVAAGKRVVVFHEHGAGDAPRPAYYHRLFDESWDTAHAVESAGGFGCGLNRGNPGAALFVLNHFVSNPGGSESAARAANAPAVIAGHAHACESVQLPNVLAVDFYEQAAGVATTAVPTVVRLADELNGLTPR